MNNSNNKKQKSLRSIAAKAINRVAYRGDSLQTIQIEIIPTIDESSRALAYEMIWGTIRHFYALEKITQELLSSPLAKKHQDIQSLLLLGLYQLTVMRIPEYAAVSETVNATDDLKKSWARKLINGCLRTFLRQKELYLADFKQTSTLPNWLQKQISHDWPEHQEAIEKAFNQPAELTLRVNELVNTREEYQSKLDAAGIKSRPSDWVSSALILEKNHSVLALPEFNEGHVSIQSESAQLVAKLLTDLNTQTAPKILDACAAPGGKACHLLEAIPNAQLDCVEIDKHRIGRIEENFTRLKLSANIHINDASQPQTWDWLDNDSAYDFVLIDAPCSGTGVISKHPDIKIHRTEKDVNALTKLQSELIANLWPLVKKDGYLIYLTCSILKKENQHQIKHFLSQYQDVEIAHIDECYGINVSPIGEMNGQFLGRQRLPKARDLTQEKRADDSNNEKHHSIFDGFYYCAIKKV